MEIEIKRLNNSGAEQNFVLQYLKEHWKDTSRAKKAMEESLKNEVLPSFFIAHYDGDPIGMIFLTDEDDIGFAERDGAMLEEKVKPWMMCLYVKPEFRQKGVGTDLVKYCENFSKINNFEYLYLDSAKKGDFYRKMSYEYIGNQPWEDGITEIFRKKLN